MTKDIGRHAATSQPRHQKVRSRQIIAVWLAALTVLLLGCNDGEDRLRDLVSGFSAARHEMNEVRELLSTLERTDAIAGILMGILYNETPDRVIFRDEKLVTYTEVMSAKATKGQVELERIRDLARKLGCKAVRLDKTSGSVWITMHYGRNHDWGYVFGRNLGMPTREGEQYLAIPGAEDWYAFRR